MSDLDKNQSKGNEGADQKSPETVDEAQAALDTEKQEVYDQTRSELGGAASGAAEGVMGVEAGKSGEVIETNYEDVAGTEAAGSVENNEVIDPMARFRNPQDVVSVVVTNEDGSTETVHVELEGLSEMPEGPMKEKFKKMVEDMVSSGKMDKRGRIKDAMSKFMFTVVGFLAKYGDLMVNPGAALDQSVAAADGSVETNNETNVQNGGSEVVAVDPDRFQQSELEALADPAKVSDILARDSDAYACEVLGLPLMPGDNLQIKLQNNIENYQNKNFDDLVKGLADEEAVSNFEKAVVRFKLKGQADLPAITAVVTDGDLRYFDPVKGQEVILDGGKSADWPFDAESMLSFHAPTEVFIKQQQEKLKALNTVRFESNENVKYELGFDEVMKNPEGHFVKASLDELKAGRFNTGVLTVNEEIEGSRILLVHEGELLAPQIDGSMKKLSPDDAVLKNIVSEVYAGTKEFNQMLENAGGNITDWFLRS